MKEIVYWPSWKHGPNGQSAIFGSPEEVPTGWFDTRQQAEEYDAANITPPEDGPDYWKGYSKEYLFQVLRKAGHKIHANMSVRKAFEKCEELNLFNSNAEEGSENGEQAGTV